MASPPTPTVPLDEAQTPVDGDAESVELTPGTRIGRYLVVEKIGQGGAGAVYAAFDAKLDRKVALKLLQAGGGGPLRTLDPRWPQLVGEARMLAKLSDPEVVTVFDVGEHDGVGYLAMELVSGGDLAGWIDRHRGPDAGDPKTLRDALTLMLQAGEGLAHAHRAGLVHGDFKPGNVLIDTKGRAKVSDFGIARLRGGPAGYTDEQTSPGASSSGDQLPQGRTAETGRGPRWIGTPAFMAPEQFDGLLPSEQTDVYAYCTALYQAVYGVLPWSARSMLELATLKGHTAPQRPSGAKVPRWLDRVLDRGLSTDPKARYPSMEAVLADLRRGVRGRRTARILAAASTLALVGAAGALWVTHREQGALCETEGFGWDASTRDRVRSAFEALGHRAPRQAWSRVNDRMSALDEAWAQAWAQACRARDSPALQQRSLDCLQRQRRQADALVVAWTQGEDRGVEVVDRASRAAAALAEPDQCLAPDALASGDQVPEDPELTEAVGAARAQLDAAVALSRAGRVADALPKAKAAMAAAEGTAFTPVVAEASLVLGRTLERSGDIEGAAAAMERAYFEGVSAEAHALVAEAASRLVWIVGARLEKHDEGLLWAQHAEAAMDKAGGGRRDQLMTNVAGLLERKGEYAESLAMLREALAATPAQEGFDQGLVHQRIGDALRRQGKDEAIQHYQQTIDLWTEALGSAHPNVAIAKTSWASGLSRAGRPAEAEVAYREALTELEAAFGAKHPTLSATLQNLGIALKNQGKFDEAEPVLRRAVEIDAAVFGPDHLKTADRREALGRLLTRRGKGSDALAEHEAAGKIYVKALEPGHPWIILNRINRGDALRQMSAPERAADAYEAGYEAAKASLQRDDALLHDAAAHYGRALVETARYDRAVAVLGPALRALRETKGYEDAVAIAGWALARAQVEQGGPLDDALALAKASREGLAAWPEEQAALDAWVAAHE